MCYIYVCILSFQYIIQVIFLKGFLGPLMKKDTVAKFKDGSTSKCYIFHMKFNIVCKSVETLWFHVEQGDIQLYRSENKPNKKATWKMEEKRCI